MPLPQNYRRRNNLHDDRSRSSLFSLNTYNNNVGVVSEDSLNRGKKRWIRRKREDESNTNDIDNAFNNEKYNDSEALEARSENAENAEIQYSSEHNNYQKESACPLSSYSMTFPRYRIDKTTLITNTSSSLKEESVKRRIRRMKQGIITKLGNNNEQQVRRGNNSPLSILNDIFGELANLTKNSEESRKSVESFYHGEIQNGNFRWIDADGVSSKSKLDVDFRVAADFWKMASDITTHLAIGEQQVIVENNFHQQLWYLALPETTSSVAQSLCDILNWYSNYSLEQITKENHKKTADRISIRSDLDLRYAGNTIPVVKFTVTFDNSEIIRQATTVATHGR